MRASAFIVLCCASFPLHAETIYKSVDANGGIVYSDVPIAGVKMVDRFEMEGGARGPKAESEDVTLAERALASAERALNQGRNPLPHELVAGGGGRLSETYFERVLALERAVEQARARLQQQITQYQP